MHISASPNCGEKDSFCNEAEMAAEETAEEQLDAGDRAQKLIGFKKNPSKSGAERPGL